MNMPRFHHPNYIKLKIDEKNTYDVFKYTVTNLEYLNFINKQDILADEALNLRYDFYKRINIYNLNCPFQFFNGKFYLRAEYDMKPVAHISYFAAQEFALYHNAILISDEVWLKLLSIDKNFYLESYKKNLLNICDLHGYTNNVNDGLLGPSGIYDLIGNIRYWGNEVSTNLANCFGVSFNKSLNQSNSLFILPRLKNLGSISVGVRLMRLST